LGNAVADAAGGNLGLAAEWLRGLQADGVQVHDDIDLAGSVDVLISTCVLHHSADKAQVLREAARVLQPGGRFAISDVIADDDMDEAPRADMTQWTGCIAGALTRREFEEQLAAD